MPVRRCCIGSREAFCEEDALLRASRSRKKNALKKAFRWKTPKNARCLSEGSIVQAMAHIHFFMGSRS